MDHETDNRKLLAEVLAESAPADVREAMLSQTLLAVRRRRRVRQAWQGIGMLCAVILLAVLTRPQMASSRKPPPLAKAAVRPGYQLVRTEPFSARLVISTEPFPAGQMVASAATVTEIATTRDSFHLINDHELLALTAEHPAILVRTGPDSEELVFADSPDRKGFPAN